MIYNSVAEIYDSLEKTRRRLQRRVESLSEAQQNFRPQPDAWSISEIVEHLALVEGQVAQLTGKLLSRVEAASTNGEFKPISLAALVERGLSEKFQAPETARPRGGVAVAESLSKLNDSRAKLLDLRPRIETTDLSEVRFPHPAFGPINLYEWLAITGMHEERHIGQIKNIMSSPGFEAA